MSLSSPEDSDGQNQKSSDDVQMEDSCIGGTGVGDVDAEDSTVGGAYCLPLPRRYNVMIESENDSIASDYSEMADPIKEHLANVQIIQKEDLDMGNIGFAVQPKICRECDEDEEDFVRRVRKTNYLSLAQEFAELKKVAPEVLPFGLHKDEYQRGGGSGGGGADAMSDSGSETDGVDRSESSVSGSVVATPMEGQKSFVNNGESVDASDGTGQVEGARGRTSIADYIAKDDNHVPAIPDFCSDSRSNANRNLTAFPTTSSFPHTGAAGNHQKNETSVAESRVRERDRHCGSTLDVIPDVVPGDVVVQSHRTAVPPSSVKPSSDGGAVVVVGSAADSPAHRRSAESTPSKKAEHLKRRSIDDAAAAAAAEDFDIFTIESALPHMDWVHLEEQLQRSAEEEKKKQVCQSMNSRSLLYFALLI